ncbi:hypothetical protein M422DRAFT_57684 [Sphaerobolus stellatus SS14]|nr:hypothetical protein M422DRAFT_57684 [Sphaerobolus stellatus SS14]
MPPPKNEEDLDDLDDVLEEFNAPPPRPSAPAPTAQTASNASVSTTPVSRLESSTSANLSDDAISEDFARQFAKEMEAMLLGGADSSETSRPAETEEAKKFREAWEKMLIDELEADPNQQQKDTPGKDKQKEEPVGDDTFQKAILQAMEKMQTSDEALKADEKNTSGDDTLEKLLSTLGDLNLDDAEGGEGLDSMLESMMSQLMSKEILYDPLKELDTKYPEYLEKNGPTLDAAERERCVQQSKRVQKIVAIFEKPSYSEDDTTTSSEILRLMNEMQGFGSPPNEIMGDMPPGFELGQDGLPKMPDGCIIS